MTPVYKTKLRQQTFIAVCLYILLKRYFSSR
uniref:Uncharacterized protein n=1 Tax=Arundo donax TaxID=35708 RepID=A0A0A9UH69_ARUDO